MSIVYEYNNSTFINKLFFFWLCIKYLTSKLAIISISKIFRLNVWYFCVIICFLTELLTLGILFSTAIDAALVAKPEILSILPSISVILALYQQSTSVRHFLVCVIIFSRIDLSVSCLVFKNKSTSINTIYFCD